MIYKVSEIYSIKIPGKGSNVRYLVYNENPRDKSKIVPELGFEPKFVSPINTQHYPRLYFPTAEDAMKFNKTFFIPGKTEVYKGRLDKTVAYLACFKEKYKCCKLYKYSGDMAYDKDLVTDKAKKVIDDFKLLVDYVDNHKGVEFKTISNYIMTSNEVTIEDTRANLPLTATLHYKKGTRKFEESSFISGHWEDFYDAVFRCVYEGILYIKYPGSFVFIEGLTLKKYLDLGAKIFEPIENKLKESLKDIMIDYDDIEYVDWL